MRRFREPDIGHAFILTIMLTNETGRPVQAKVRGTLRNIEETHYIVDVVDPWTDTTTGLPWGRGLKRPEPVEGPMSLSEDQIVGADPA